MTKQQPQRQNQKDRADTRRQLMVPRIKTNKSRAKEEKEKLKKAGQDKEEGHKNNKSKRALITF